MQGIKVLSVNISEKKGTIKHPVNEILLNETGVVNDAHAGMLNRGISLLGIESIRKFQEEINREIQFGEFAENITSEGMELFRLKPLDRFANENLEIEITQIGKKCHGDNCSIFREVGNCVMPKEGIFARVVRKGIVRPGDFLEYKPNITRILILTTSDRAFRGEYEDRSGPRIREILSAYYAKTGLLINISLVVIPDDAAMLTENIQKTVEEDYQFIFTTGGTGIGPRDITVDVVKSMLDKEIPGIMELIRYKYGSEKPQALLSRSIAGLISKTFIFTLPGSVRAVEEYLAEILKSERHLVYMLNALDLH